MKHSKSKAYKNNQNRHLELLVKLTNSNDDA